MSEPAFEIVHVEGFAARYPEKNIYVPPLDKRAALTEGMRAMIMLVNPEPFARGEYHRERHWMKIIKVEPATQTTSVIYTGKLLTDTLNIDAEAGDEFSFTPEHVLEWDVPPRGPKIRR